MERAVAKDDSRVSLSQRVYLGVAGVLQPSRYRNAGVPGENSRGIDQAEGWKSRKWRDDQALEFKRGWGEPTDETNVTWSVRLSLLAPNK